MPVVLIIVAPVASVVKLERANVPPTTPLKVDVPLVFTNDNVRAAPEEFNVPPNVIAPPALAVRVVLAPNVTLSL